MQHRRYGLIATLLVLAPLTGAPQDDTAKAILEKAIKAHGGAKQLAKLKVRREKSKATLQAGGETFTLTTDSLLELPDRERATVQRGISTDTVVINGDKGWFSTDGQTKAYTAALLKGQRDRLHWNYVLTLAPLVQDKRFVLSPLGETKVADHRVLGVRVSASGYTDVDLYFDKKSGLLAKWMVRLQSLSNDGDAILFESVCNGYKEVDGLKWPMKQQHYANGTLITEAEITELRLLDKIDEGTFAKP